jgi:broad specificity phosphatase PhoE
VRIGLIRHFPVELAMPSGWKTAAQLHTWRQDYESAGVREVPADLGGFTWSLCIASDVRRAYVTANAIFSGPVTQTELLREAQFAEFQTGKLRLPVWVWRLMLLLSWTAGHRSQRACRDEFRRRVLELADRLEAGTDDTLVVSHAGMMAYLSTELRRRGFNGPKFRLAKHAHVYVYEKTSKPDSGGESRGLTNGCVERRHCAPVPIDGHSPCQIYGRTDLPHLLSALLACFSAADSKSGRRLRSEVEFDRLASVQNMPADPRMAPARSSPTAG